MDTNPPMNYAVNNDGDYYPQYHASYTSSDSALSRLGDGQYVYDVHPTNRWTTAGSPHAQDWVEVDFGVKRPVDTVKLYVLDDGANSPTKIGAPAKIQLGYWTGLDWQSVPGARAATDRPLDNQPYVIQFPKVQTARLRATLTHAASVRSGLTEFEALGPGTKPFLPAPPPAGNLAYNRTNEGFPKASASHSDVFGGVPHNAVDGKIIFNATPMNRWTSFGSPDPKDWLQIDFGKKTRIGRAVLYIYNDGGGVQPPTDYVVEGFIDGNWKELPGQVKLPTTPTGGMASTVAFPAAEVEKARVMFTHKGQARSGVTELEMWEK